MGVSSAGVAMDCCWRYLGVKASPDDDDAGGVT